MANHTPQGQKKSSKGWRITFVVALIVFLISIGALGVMIFRYWIQQNAYSDLESFASVEEPSTAYLKDMTVDWDELRQINPDIVGWVYVPNSKINYPIVQGPDNYKYLNTAFDGSNGWFSSAGTIFLDENNDPLLNDQNNFIYGHHMRDGSMFAAITDWENSDEFNKHRDVYILTPQGNYYCKSFALLETTGSDPIVTLSFPTEQDYTSYIQKIIDRSKAKQSIYILSAQQVKQSFALSTCEYDNVDGRAILYCAVIATTVPDDPYVPCDPLALSGLAKDESHTFGQ